MEKTISVFFPEVPTSSNWRAAARLSDAAAKIACAAAAVLGLERGSQSWRRTRWTSPYQKYDQENTLYSHFTNLKNISHLPHKTVSKSSTSINFHSRNTRSSLSVCAVSSSTTSTVGGMLPSVDPSRSSWKPNDSTEGILVANHLNEMIEIFICIYRLYCNDGNASAAQTQTVASMLGDLNQLSRTNFVKKSHSKLKTKRVAKASGKVAGRNHPSSTRIFSLCLSSLSIGSHDLGVHQPESEKIVKHFVKIETL